MPFNTIEQITSELSKLTNASDTLLLNLAQFLTEIETQKANAIITRIPEIICENEHFDFRSVGIFAKTALAEGGYLALIEEENTLPQNLRFILRELQYVGVFRISDTSESVVLFKKVSEPNVEDFKKIIRFQKQTRFEDYADVVTTLTNEADTIINPFENELEIRKIVINSGRFYITADSSLPTTEEMIASMEVL